MGASGERGRLARGVWRPAKHTLVRCPVARDDTLGIHSLKTLGGEKRGEVRRETHRTASETLALPNHSSRARRQGGDGVALVVTLLMLSVITFLAIAFLSMSRSNRSAVSASLDAA